MNEKRFRILSIVSIILAFLVLLAALPFTGLLTYRPQKPATKPPASSSAPATLPPPTTLPSDDEPLPEFIPSDLLSFDMEGSLPELNSALLGNAAPIWKQVSSGDGHYLSLSAEKTGDGAYFQMPSLAFSFSGEEYAKADETAFSLELTLLRTASPIPFSLSLSIGDDLLTENGGEITELTLLTLDESGELLFDEYSLGDLTEETLAVSAIFTYVPTRELYLADLYVNGRLLYTDLPFAALGEKAASALATEDRLGIAGLTISSTAIYTDVSEGSLTNGSMTVTPTHYSAFGADGKLSASLALDDLYLTKGNIHPKTSANASTLVLYVGNKTLDGFLPTQNDARVVSARVSASEEKIVLPALEGGWRSASGISAVTEVSSALLSGNGYAAYSPLPDVLLYENDFSADTEGLLLSGNTSLGTDSLLLGADAVLTLPLGNDYRTGYDPIATLTLSFTLTRLSEGMPVSHLSLGSESASSPLLLAFTEEGISLADTLLAPTPAIGEETALVLRIVFDRNGLTLTAYQDGKYLGEKTLAEHGLTLNARLATDFDHIAFSVGEGEAEPALSIGEITLSRGNDAFDFAPVPDASLRLGKDESETGLRFTFAVNRAWYEELIGDSAATVGALILPTDTLPSGISPTHDSLQDADISFTEMEINLANASTPYTYVYTASLIDIKPSNLPRSFTAVGYLKIGDDYYYSSASSSSLIKAARDFVASGELGDLDEEDQARILGYLDTTVYLDNLLTPIPLENYTLPYIVTYENGYITIRTAPNSRASLEDICAIVIGNTLYTEKQEAPWLPESGALRLPYSLQP